MNQRAESIQSCGHGTRFVEGIGDFRDDDEVCTMYCGECARIANLEADLAACKKVVDAAIRYREATQRERAETAYIDLCMAIDALPKHMRKGGEA